MINDIEEVQWAYLLDPSFQLVNTAGKPITDGWLEVYIHGTRTKYYCASDFDGTLHPFKIQLDSLGSNIVLASPAHAYDVYVYNKYGNLVMSRYNIVPSTGDGSVIKDVVNITSKDNTINVQSSDQTNWDLSIKDTVDKVSKNEQDISSIQEDMSGLDNKITEINTSLENKKDKQNELNFNGSATKTVKKITQNANGELNVEFADISAGGISAGTAIDMTDNAVSVKYSKGLEINSDNQLQVNTDIIATKESVDEVKSDLNNLTGKVDNNTTQIQQIHQILDSNSWTELTCRPYDSTIKLTILNAGYRNGFLNFNGTVEKINNTFTMNAVNYLFSIDDIALKLDFRNYYGTCAYNSNNNLFPCAMAALKNTNTFYIYPTQTANIFYFNGTVPVDLINPRSALT